MMRSERSNPVRPIAVGLLVACFALVAPGCGRADRGPVVTADFARGTGLYPGSPVRVIGIDIGRVAAVDNVDGHVRVRLQLDRGAEVPADASATVVPLTLLGERYVQLGPAHQGGPTLGHGDHIPLERTRVPAEIDDLLRGLEGFMGSVDGERAGDVVANLAQILEGRGEDLNSLIRTGAGALDVLADEGEDLQAIIGSLRDLSETLKGRTDSIESLIRNYELVTQILIDNRDDLDGVITQLDRAAVELTGLLAAHEDPLRADVDVLASTSAIVAANTENLQITLRSTVRLFEAAGRAYEERSNSLRVNNQSSPELTSDLVAGRLRDRIAGLCRRLGIDACSNPASPLMNELLALLPGLLAAESALASGEPPTPPRPPQMAEPSVPVTVPAIPTVEQLLAALVEQLEAGLDDAQLRLLATLDGPRLAALLGLAPVLLQVLGELDADQVERLRLAEPDEIGELMLQIYNEVRPPAERLDVPLLPPTKPPAPRPTLPAVEDPLSGLTGGLGG
jgi:phospholipid/cholesterol/gamma-HCH transport system substrate-binding protein